jgi:microcystin degradation protein MlrC
VKPRVLLAGLFHETHTFLPGETPLADFQVRQGEELLATAGDGSPLAGAVETARAYGWELLPAIDLRATPSATVEDRVLEEFCRGCAEAHARQAEGGIDAVFLVLHGAMVCRSHLDVEGDALRHLRALPGLERVPIVGVFDLHANFTGAMVEQSDALVAYRENPHTDAHAASVRAAQLLDRLLRHGERPQTVWAAPPVVWPPTGTGTANDPMRTLEQMARQIEAEHPEILAVSVNGGFAFADTPATGVAFSAVTVGDPAVAGREVTRLHDWAIAHRAEGNVRDMPLAEALDRLATHERGPIVLVEPSDNIGGGAPGDGTAILRALVERDVQGAGVVINDPAAVAEVTRLRRGERRTLPIGGRENTLAGPPAELDVEFLSTSDGQFDLEDPHSHLASMCGTRVNMGPSAVVRHRGVTILLTSRKTPPFDLGQWRSQGVPPESLRVIAVKAAVAHRRAYDKIAAASYTVDTPGPCTSNLRSLPYRRIRRPIYPLDEI